MKIHMIPNWRKAWRMLSVQLAAVAVAWGMMPTDAQASMLAAIGIPGERVPALLGLLFLVSRLVDQPKVRAE
jgi:hypothetical protein